MGLARLSAPQLRSSRAADPVRDIRRILNPGALGEGIERWIVKPGAGQLKPLMERSIRLGVTGFRRSGKTVFLTSLIHNLLSERRNLPFLDGVGEDRLIAARLRPQRNPTVARFDYERHAEALTGADAHWPEPTTGISQMRLAVRFRPSGFLRSRLLQAATLNLDIVDYPGEWLLDLPLLHRTFADWSRETLELAAQSPRAALAADWLRHLSTRDPAAQAEEAEARRLAELYTAYLKACRDSDAHLSLLQPGRFLEPGDLAGAPLLTFSPILVETGSPPKGSLAALMAERFEAYKTHVVRRFYAEHFARVDRQLVLVDILGTLNAGMPALLDLQMALRATLESFRHGRASWLAWLTGRRIDRVLFAASKADHVASTQHANLRLFLSGLVAESASAIKFEGARAETIALAAVRSTESVQVAHEGQTLSCVRGVPVGADGPLTLFPGEIPESHHLLERERRRFDFHAFRPPQGLRRDQAWPHVRLDQALQFLIGDVLA